MNDAEYRLHDRATRGESLSAEEQAALDAWYARLDAEEASLLSAPANQNGTDALAALRKQVAQAEENVLRLLRQNQETADQNEALRAEINQLKARLGALTGSPASSTVS